MKSMEALGWVLVPVEFAYVKMDANGTVLAHAGDETWAGDYHSTIKKGAAAMQDYVKLPGDKPISKVVKLNVAALREIGEKGEASLRHPEHIVTDTMDTLSEEEEQELIDAFRPK
jgi:hypothetical protein